MEEFKISAYACCEIMGVKGLGKTGEIYLKEWYLKKKYGRKKDFYVKYIEKGLAVEHKGIEMLSDIQGIELSKNEQWFDNDFMKGTPDVIHNGVVFDIKSSWNIFSFPFFDKELPNKDYYWQLQVYMALTGLKQASIVYCLIDTPKPIVQQELKKLYFQSGGTAELWTPDTYRDLEENYTFNDIPESDRIKEFSVTRNDADIALIEQRVNVCREYLKSLG